MNREERSPLPKDFHWGVNVAWLHDVRRGSPCLFATQANGEKFPVAPGPDWEPSVGDELLIWNTGADAHSLSIMAYDGELAVTSNYGVSGCSAAVFPGAKLGNSSLLFRSGHWWLGEGVHAKQVQRVIRLVDAIETLTARANLDGIPFDSNFTGEVSDFITNERPKEDAMRMVGDRALDLGIARGSIPAGSSGGDEKT